MSEIGSIQPEPEFAAFIGIDWADQKHIWCLQTAGSAKREIGELEHTPEAVESWVAHLYQRFAQRPIAVAVEQSRGALVFMLSKYEPLHLFPVPSQMASSMRQALYPSGAKDDPRDADLLLDLLLQHRNKLRRLSPDSEATRRVQNLVEERRKLVDEKTAQINRLTDHLKVYFPQMLEWFGRLDSDVVCAYWSGGQRSRSYKRLRRRVCALSSASTGVGIENRSSTEWKQFAKAFRPFAIGR